MKPHEIVGQVADGIAGAVKGVGNGLVRTVEGVGSQINSVLNKPFEMTIHKDGPQQIVNNLATGTLNAASGLADSGINALQNEGRAIMGALDEPAKEFGFPPDMGSFSMPSLPRTKK
ncbi:MAG: hypothetical protein PHI12_06970 [Dehalococcoidales bacterium]|nr:hypothetical protein [Dehalococcoidales bacterium]